MEERRPNPDILLETIKQDDDKRGKLKIYYGYAAGVGKTYTMLEDAQQQLNNGVDIVVGYVEPHQRPATTEKLKSLPFIPVKKMTYHHMTLKEFDIDAALKRKPELIIVDELAHTNVEGSRNKKRYQDIEELLNAGIDVYTTVNVQHKESLNDIVESITHVKVAETVPDYIFQMANQIEVIDIEPDELLKRMQKGEIYQERQAHIAQQNFFTVNNLRRLRELVLRDAADKLGNDNLKINPVDHGVNLAQMIVCIGPSPSSEKLIRWAARAAEAFHAKLLAVYVERTDNETLPPEQNKQLQLNMALAKKLGAQLVVLANDNMAKAIADYADLVGVTNIVIGKGRQRSKWQSVGHEELEDQLLHLNPNFEIHIVPQLLQEAPTTPPLSQRIKRWFNQGASGRDALVSLAILVLATLLSSFVDRYDELSQVVIVIYVFAVFLTSWLTAGRFYGILVSFISVGCVNFFFTKPLYTLDVAHPLYLSTFVIMLLIALMTSTITNRLLKQADQAVKRETRTQVLFRISQQLLSTRGYEQIARLGADYITKLLNESVVFYLKPTFADTFDLMYTHYVSPDSPKFNHDNQNGEIIQWVQENKKHAGAGTETFSQGDVYYVPILSQGDVLGIIGVQCGKAGLDQQTILLLNMIVSQIALALERQHLSDEQRQIIIETEKEKVRGNLLRAISHDIRTPLSSILGSVSILTSPEGEYSAATQAELLKNIQDESQWLIQMVENLLSITRISEDGVTIQTAPEAAEELVAEAIARINKRYPDREIQVTVPNEYVEITVDGTLIVQVLINIIENAIKYSPAETPVQVELKQAGNEAVFQVIDHGPGIQPDQLPWLGGTHSSQGTDRTDTNRGFGIGLSICQTIITVHKGTLTAHNQPEGGALFEFRLPIEGAE